MVIRRRHKPNTYTVIEESVELDISQDKKTLVDVGDLDRVMEMGRWFAQKSTTTDDYYARSYRVGLLSRFIMCAPQGAYVDHRNHDTLNNRKENLRVCDPIKSARNRVRQTNSTSGLIGVDWHKLVGKWQARITVDGVRVRLGFFEDKEDAGRARDRAAKEAYGDFVVLNFPE